MTEMTQAPEALSFRELMDYTGEETRRWEGWLRELGPAALAVGLGEAKWGSVGGLAYHVFMVELRYAERLLGEPVTPYQAAPPATLDEIFAVHARARGLLERFLATARPGEWGETLTFETVSAGTMSASKRKIVAHALLHGIRHWAQVATALRQAGYPGAWMHDLMASSALD